jgi:Mn2+/Fe2+ NRAMP family transporter
MPASFVMAVHLDLNQLIKLQETFVQLVTIVLVQVCNFVDKALRVFTKVLTILVLVCLARKDTIVKVVLMQPSHAQQATSVHKDHTSIRLQLKHQLLVTITLLGRNNRWHALSEHTQE